MSQAQLDAVIDQKLEAHNARIDGKLESFALQLASTLRGEIRDILKEQVPNMSNVSNPSHLSAPQSVPFRQEPVVVTDPPVRNPHLGEEGLGGDALGRVPPGNIESPLPGVSVTAQSASHQLVETLRGLGVTMSLGIADRIMGAAQVSQSGTATAQVTVVGGDGKGAGSQGCPPRW